MYCFQESLPASRPPPVSFSPPVNREGIIICLSHHFVYSSPNAPPISAPLVGIFTFTIPQSEPNGLHKLRINRHTRVVYIQCRLPHPLKHFANISCEETACQTLSHFIVPGHTFLKSLPHGQMVVETTMRVLRNNSQNTWEHRGLVQKSPVVRWVSHVAGRWQVLVQHSNQDDPPPRNWNNNHATQDRHSVCRICW